MKNRNIPVQPFEPRDDRRSRPVRVVVIGNHQELWRHHYNIAIENGNNPPGAKRFADLMAK